MARSLPPAVQAGPQTVTKPLASMMGPTSCSDIMAIMRETSYLCKDGRTWPWAEVKAFLPMIVVSGTLSVLAARQARHSGASGKPNEL